MYTSKFIIYLFAAFLSLGIIASCSKKSSTAPDYNANKAAFKATIDSLTNVYNTTVDGSKPGQYVIGARAALDSVLALAGQVYAGTTFTQQQVNNAMNNLIAAGKIFSTKLLQEVSVANLVAHWKFNGDALDSTGHGHDGILKSGLVGPSPGIDGNTLPVLVPDRFGRAGKAIDLTNGAYVEVPYDATLNPKEFTFSLWMKHHITFCDSYILSLNRWNGFKFQLQCGNFAYLTVHSDNGFLEADDNPGAIPIDVWTHVVVSYTNGAMKFYVNGSLLKTAAFTGIPSTLTDHIPLAIGQQLPKEIYNSSSTGDYDYYGPAFFNGSLDDIRIYNRALSDAEVLSIYIIEKDL